MPKIKALAIGDQRIDLMDAVNLQQEIQNRQDGDKTITETVDKLQKIYTYTAGLEIKSGYIVIYANKLYVSTAEFTTTTWDVDEANLVLTDSDTISCINYDANIKVIKGQLVIYNNKLYICSKSIDNTTDWATDEPNMIITDAEVDLTDYYNKTEANALFDNKADKTAVGDTADLSATDKNTVVAAINEINDKKQEKLVTGEGIDITGDTISSKTKVITETQYNGLADKGTDIIYIITD